MLDLGKKAIAIFQVKIKAIVFAWKYINSQKKYDLFHVI